jgi:hypothetical protein
MPSLSPGEWAGVVGAIFVGAPALPAAASWALREVA